jgi:hypothetical protein
MWLNCLINRFEQMVSKWNRFESKLVILTAKVKSVTIGFKTWSSKRE